MMPHLNLAIIFVRIPDRYCRVVCRYQDGVRRAKPLARSGNSQLNRNSPVYYRESGKESNWLLFARTTNTWDSIYIVLRTGGTFKKLTQSKSKKKIYMVKNLTE